MWDVYTYGGGEYLVQVFGAVALFFGGPFQSLAQVAGLLGLTAILMAHLGPKHNFDAAYILRFAVFYGALFVPKADIAVVDRITPVLGGGVVQQVPFGLAVFANFTSFIGDRLTTLYETAMSFPADQRYQANGMVFGATLLKSAPQVNFSDATFAGDMSLFLDICAGSMFANDPTLVDQVEKSQDVWGLLSGLAQANRFVQISSFGAPVSCQTAANDLNARIAAEEARALQRLGKVMWPYKNVALAQADASNLLSPTALDLAGINMNSSQMVRQAMMVNAIEAGLDRLPPTETAGALASIQAKTAAEKQRSNVYMTMGAVASRSIPLMRSVLEAIAYALFPVIGVMILLPMGLMAFLNYFVVLMWLQMWPVLYAVLNSIIYWYSQQANTTGAMMPSGLTDWTMWSLPGIAETNSEIVALAGYMAISIPMISYMLIRGGAQIGSQVASSLTQPSQQAASQAGSQSAMGNVQMGVVGMDTLSANNATQWQYKTGFSYDGNTGWRSGMHTNQSGLDQTRTDMGTGQTAYDAKLQFSDIGAKVDWKSTFNNAYSMAYDRAMTAGSSDVIAGVSGRMAAYEKVLGYSAEHQKDKTRRTGDATHQDVEYGRATSALREFGDRFSIGGSFTRQDAATLAGLATLDGKDAIETAAMVLPVGRFTSLIKGALARQGKGGAVSETGIEAYHAEINAKQHAKKQGVPGVPEKRNGHGFPVGTKDDTGADATMAEHAPEKSGRSKSGVTMSMRGAIDSAFKSTLEEVSQYIKSNKLDDKAMVVERAQLGKVEESTGDTVRKTGSDQRRSTLRESEELVERGEATLQRAETLRNTQTRMQSSGVDVTANDNERFVDFLKGEGVNPNDFYHRLSDARKTELVGKFQQEYAAEKSEQLLKASGLSSLPSEEELEARIMNKNAADRENVQQKHDPNAENRENDARVNGLVGKNGVRPNAAAPAGYGEAADRGKEIEEKAQKTITATEKGLDDHGNDTKDRVEKKLEPYSGSGATNVGKQVAQVVDEASGGSSPEKPRNWGEENRDEFRAEPGHIKSAVSGAGNLVDRAVNTVKGWTGGDETPQSQQAAPASPQRQEPPSAPPQPAAFRGGNSAPPVQAPAKPAAAKDDEPSMGEKVGGVVLGSIFQTWSGLNRESERRKNEE